MKQLVNRWKARLLLTKDKWIMESINVTDIVCIMTTTTQQVTLHTTDMEIKGCYEKSDKCQLKE